MSEQHHLINLCFFLPVYMGVENAFHLYKASGGSIPADCHLPYIREVNFPILDMIIPGVFDVKKKILKLSIPFILWCYVIVQQIPTQTCGFFYPFPN